MLLHELAHVKRRDCLTHVLAQLACAIHWFNPLAWIAARHVRTERERACDDLVLASGTKGPDYAEQLLEIARVMRSGRFPALMTGATLAMAHRSQLEGRLMAILDPRCRARDRRRVRTALAAIVAACALMPLASLQPWTVAQAAAAIETSVPAAQDADASATPSATPSQSPSPSPPRRRRPHRRRRRRPPRVRQVRTPHVPSRRSRAQLLRQSRPRFTARSRAPRRARFKVRFRARCRPSARQSPARSRAWVREQARVRKAGAQPIRGWSRP